jgi:hypothetical protein
MTARSAAVIRAMNNFSCNVAGFRFRVEFAADANEMALTANYELFARRSGGDDLFRLTVVGSLSPRHPAAVLVGRFDDDAAGITVWALPGGGYRFHIVASDTPDAPDASCVGSDITCLETDAFFADARCTLPSNPRLAAFGLNNCLMLCFAFASASRGALLVHASAVLADGWAWLFLGRSGTGKSTHSRLWLGQVAGCRLLNDDNPVIRRFPDGSVRAYGSPWSGKTPCHLDEDAPIGAFVQLRQASRNAIAANRPARAFACLLASCSTMMWDERVHGGTCDTLARIAESVASFTLDCLPDRAAAALCHATLTGCAGERCKR